MLETVLGSAAAAWGILMAISPGLQIRKMLVHRSSREISIAYFWVLLVGFVLWIAYGLMIENWYLVVPNAVAFTVCATTIAVALRYRLREPGGRR
jgi:MtN3 and saliva related transmembrane protein